MLGTPEAGSISAIEGPPTFEAGSDASRVPSLPKIEHDIPLAELRRTYRPKRIASR